MRVLLLVTDLQQGGTPLRIARLARELAALGAQVTVGSLADTGPVGAALRDEGVPVVTCDARHARDVAALRRLARHVRLVRPHLIHATLFHANVAARLVGLWLRVPVVTSAATIEVERPWHNRLERLTARWDRGMIVNSAALARHARRAFGRPAARIYRVPPSVAAIAPQAPRDAVRAALGVGADDFLIAWSGRFDPVKRIELILQAAEVNAGRRCTWLLVGDGPTRAACEGRLRVSSARSVVRLLGWRDDLPDILNACDAAVCASLTEGMPNAVLEAMAAGLPVVAVDTPGLRELAGAPTAPDGVAHERMLLCLPDPAALARGVALLADDPARRAALGAAARAWVLREAAPGRAAAATRDVYRAVLQRRGGWLTP